MTLARQYAVFCEGCHLFGPWCATSKRARQDAKHLGFVRVKSTDRYRARRIDLCETCARERSQAK